VADVPLAWPSVVRQRVRNDYPLHACLELGARYGRVPATDPDDALQRERLAVLRDEGVAVVATWLWHDRLDLAAEITHHEGALDGAEVQVPGVVRPPASCLDSLARAARAVGGRVSLTLAPVLPNDVVPGKQLRRTRIGYRVSEVGEVNRALEACGRFDAGAVRVACRVDAASAPWDVARAYLALPPLMCVGGVDWLVALPEAPAAAHAARAAEAVFAAALVPGCRVFLEPLVDLDRTMDTAHGLLDRRCNPRPAFDAVRVLNTILYASPAPTHPLAPPEPGEPSGPRTLCLSRASRAYCLRLPATSGASSGFELPREDLDGSPVLEVAPDARFDPGSTTTYALADR
jgi:hypothetical protein